VKNYSHIILFVLILFQMFNISCIQEKLVEADNPNPGPAQHERWTYTLRCPAGTWNYRIGLNPKLVNSAWVAKEATITESANPLLYANTFTVSPSMIAPATGEVIQYGTKDFVFYSSDSWVSTLLADKEDLEGASLLIEPDSFKINKYNFTNGMSVRFFYYAGDWRTPPNETVVALLGDFNNWGKGGDRSKMEMKDDGVFPDAAANDGIWTIEIPLESTFTYKYKFLIDAQWNGTDGEWDTGSGTWVPDYANPLNTYESHKGDSYLTVK